MTSVSQKCLASFPTLKISTKRINEMIEVRYDTAPSFEFIYTYSSMEEDLLELNLQTNNTYTPSASVPQAKKSNSLIYHFTNANMPNVVAKKVVKLVNNLNTDVIDLHRLKQSLS